MKQDDGISARGIFKLAEVTEQTNESHLLEEEGSCELKK